MAPPHLPERRRRLRRHDGPLRLGEPGELRAEIQLLDRGPGAGERGGGLLDEAPRLGGGERPGLGAAQGHARRRPVPGHLERAAEGLREHGDGREVADEEAQGVERGGEGLDAVERKDPEGRLPADHAAVGGGTDDGAGGLGAERGRKHARGHGGGRAARGAPRRARGVAGVAGLARGEEGELGGDGLAEDHRPGCAQPRHAGGVARRTAPAVDGRSAGGGHVRRVDDVLHAHREAAERRPGRDPVQAARLRERLLGLEVLEGQDPRLLGSDALEAVPQELLGGDLAAGEERHRLGGAEVRERPHGPVHGLILGERAPGRARNRSRQRGEQKRQARAARAASTAPGPA